MIRFQFPKYFFSGQVRDTPQEVVDQLKDKLKLLNTFIGNNKYVTGDHITIADFALFLTGFNLENTGFDLTEYPGVNNWIKTVSTEHPYTVEIAGEMEQMEEFTERIKKLMSTGHKFAR